MISSAVPGTPRIPADPVDAFILSIRQFGALLSNYKYQEAAEALGKSLQEFTSNIYLGEFRAVMIDHMAKTSGPTATCGLLLEVLVNPEAATRDPLLHVDWMKSNGSWFTATLQAYIKVLSKSGFTHARISENLSQNLAGFLTYPQFTLEQAKILIAELPGFDPRKPTAPSYAQSRSFLEYARRFSNRDVVDYLESLAPSSSRAEIEPNAVTVDFSQFKGVDELKGKTAKPGIGFLDTVLKIYSFIGKNPALEGNEEFFRQEMKCLVEKYRYSPKDALERVRKSYQKFIYAFESVKSQLEKHEIGFYGTEELPLDLSISDGRKNIGIITFNGKRVVCKFITSMPAQFASFRDIKRLSKFVLKSIMLRTHVPNVVKIFPYVILNKTEEGKTIQIGYLMDLEPGEQLRKIPRLSSSDTHNIQNQFNTAVGNMLKSGYALYDFNDDNVLWDGQKLTFIDLNPAGFKSRALEHADTADVMLRMSMMLSKKEQNHI